MSIYCTYKSTMKMKATLDLKRFWRWCMLYRTIGLILNSIHRLICRRQKTTTFRRLDLSPSSGGLGLDKPISWARQKELVSVIGDSITQWVRPSLSNEPNWVGLSCPNPPEDGDRSSLRNVVVFCLLHTRRWIEFKISAIVLKATCSSQTLVFIKLHGVTLQKLCL
jgi:hypothetical protein